MKAKSKFGDHTVNGRSNGLHDVYAIMLGGSGDMIPWMDKKKNTVFAGSTEY